MPLGEPETLAEACVTDSLNEHDHVTDTNRMGENTDFEATRHRLHTDDGSAAEGEEKAPSVSSNGGR